MAAELFLLPFRPALSANGLILPGAKLYFYLTGTTTESPVFSDETMETPLPNPVVANAAGVFPPIYYSSNVIYRIRLYDEDNQLLDEVDPYIPGIADVLAGELGTLASQVASNAQAASNAALSAVQSAQTANQAVGIIAALGEPYSFFASKAAAISAAPTLPNGFVFVLKDESQGNDFTVYQVTGGSLSGSPIADLSPAPTGTMAAQNSNSVNITGGQITGTDFAPHYDTEANLSALAAASALLPYGVYFDTTNARLKLAVNPSTLITIGPGDSGGGGGTAATYSTLSSNFTSNSSTLVDTGLEIDVSALDPNSTYRIKMMALCDITSNRRYKLNFTAVSNVSGGYSINCKGENFGLSEERRFPIMGLFTSAISPQANMSSLGNGLWNVVTIEGVLVTSTSSTGIFKFQMRSLNGTYTFTVAKGSFIMFEKIA